jgi:hypothetical protein
MRIFNTSNFSTGSRTKDILGLLLALAVGIGGQLFLSYPVEVLIPKHPMISSRDWADSHVERELKISYKNSQNWEEKRELFTRLTSETDVYGNKAEITQNAIWYADTAKTTAEWNQPHNLNAEWQLISENPVGPDRPASRLFCHYPPVGGANCFFFAYSGHWYTRIYFSNWSNERLSSSEIQHIIARVSQLLISMPDGQVAASSPIQPALMPMTDIIIPTSAAIQPELASMPYVMPYVANLIPTSTVQPTSYMSTRVPHDGYYPTLTRVPHDDDGTISLMSCSPLQKGETRTVSAGTFIFGDVIIIDGVPQYDSNIADEETVAYFEKEANVTAPLGARCYLGTSDLINLVIQSELWQGCDSKCASIRFVLVQSDGQHVEVYR